nr:MAG TPA: hypothetical protein [Caudoviricetes sp.]
MTLSAVVNYIVYTGKHGWNRPPVVQSDSLPLCGINSYR